MIIRIATRGSALSLKQAKIVMDRILEFNKDVEFKLIIVKTTGDINLAKPLYEIGVKGIFEKEVNQAVLRGEADVAVHSLKDVPAQISDNLTLVMTPPRDDPRDALVSVKQYTVDTLPPNSIVGTSSLRRRGFLLSLRRDVEVKPIRGNVDTRIRKLNNGEYDALIMAAAGLERLNINAHVSEISPELMPPAPGQGIIGVVARRDRDDLINVLRRSNDEETFKEAIAERAFLSRIGAGCHVPLGGLASLNGDYIDFTYGIVDPNGVEKFINSIRINARDPEEAGNAAAEDLLRNAHGLVAKLLKYA
ncbi:hydroxymethylbilane synthase [Caldivirga sp. UBA161]|uniref:hydroxymethylbilane synthase n=1 Tax=Caldivirga sp. UBA161 TaxID=1915569 RepID=UPI0025B85373|nr:hydroxymethylbilane synthase [Caldivirga sp. UBA161]